jgi:hypothetical protein
MHGAHSGAFFGLREDPCFGGQNVLDRARIGGKALPESKSGSVIIAISTSFGAAPRGNGLLKECGETAIFHTFWL